MTLFAAQTDFSEPGELSLFISPSQLSMLEAVMHKAGVLSSDKMGASFALLRARDLLWTPAINTYMKGNREKVNDLMAWNSDGTRMPWRMHSEYLKQLYLQNDLSAGRFRVNGEPVNLAAITLPMFVLGTETDHVAPWRSTYKARALTRSTDYTFVLTSGGHNGVSCAGREPQAPLPRADLEKCGQLVESGAMDATGRAARGLVVAGMAGVAGCAFRALRCAAAGSRQSNGGVWNSRRRAGKLCTGTIGGTRGGDNG